MVKIIQILTYWPMNLLFSIFIKVEIHGAKYIPEIKPNIIIASNHHSKFDAFILFFSFPFGLIRKISPIHSPTSYKYYKYPHKLILGPLGAHKVPRRATSIKQYLGKSFEVLNKGGSVLLFPQGILGGFNKSSEIKPGIIYLSNDTGVEILPVVISNAESIKKNIFKLRRSHLKIEFRKPIDFEQVEITKKVLDRRGGIILKALV